MNPCLSIMAALTIRSKTHERVEAARRAMPPAVTSPSVRHLEARTGRPPAPRGAAA